MTAGKERMQKGLGWCGGGGEVFALAMRGTPGLIFRNQINISVEWLKHEGGLAHSLESGVS